MKALAMMLSIFAIAGTLAMHTIPSMSYHVPTLVKPSHRVDWNAHLVEGVKRLEGFKPMPYHCPAGVLTVGFGHTGKHASKSIDKKAAEKILVHELSQARAIVRKNVKVPLSRWQENALVSFTFNAGEKNLRTLINGNDRLNAGNYASVAELLPKYRKGDGKVLQGLVRRRAWEVDMWLGTVSL